MFRSLATLALSAGLIVPAFLPAVAMAQPATKPVESYPVHPDAVRKEGVPQGKVIQQPKWTDSKVFPGTERDWWIYVPAQYDGKTQIHQSRSVPGKTLESVHFGC